ncbi:dihydrofolate reductase family protein [Streptomyces sp. NPDC059680]|uniref:dihydrofolate reductase family protein n=1 Tax=Streptomyces sp. NPDC059680 TaxID=3346904 RepID=UPI00369A72F2
MSAGSDAAVDEGRLEELLVEAQTALPFELSDLANRCASALGLDTAPIYVVDLQQRLLIPLDETLEPLSVVDSSAGWAYRTISPRVVDADGALTIWDACPDPGMIYGGAWRGPLFVLTHHPYDARPAEGVTFLSCDVTEAVRIGLEAADGKNLEVFSPAIGRQLLERGLIDEIDLHIAPVLLGDGIRLVDSPGGIPVRLELLNGKDPSAAVNVRYHSIRSI